MSVKQRPRYINLSDTNKIPDQLLQPRTPKSIAKSRRSSATTEPSASRPSSRRSSSHGSSSTPTLLSEVNALNYFWQEFQMQEIMSPFQDMTKEERVMSYKIKTDKSSHKIDSVFGEHVPHDVSVKDICKEGLGAMLQSKVPLCYFLYYLLQEYSSENLFFLIELEQYERYTLAPKDQQRATAQHIFNTYIDTNSCFEVNLDDKVRRAVTCALENQDLNGCFDVAKPAVYALLESSYMRFQQTAVFEAMRTNCGEFITHYDSERRDAAVRMLLSYMEHDLSPTSQGCETRSLASTRRSAQRRHDLIKSMIREFCRTIVGVEFDRDQDTPMAKKPHLRCFTTKDVFDFFSKGFERRA